MDETMIDGALQDAMQPEQQQASPKMVSMSQDELNRIVSARNRAGYEKGKQEALAQAQGMGLTPEQVRELIDQKVAEARQQDTELLNAQRMIGDFTNKVQAAEQVYPGLIEKLDEIGINNVPEIIPLANSVDNVGDVLNELASNPGKMASLVTMVRQGLPHIAQKEMNKLSQSIKANQAAQLQAQNGQSRAPLSQVKSSTSGGDTGKLSVKDYMKMPYLQR